jgi:hypothetical protein
MAAFAPNEWSNMIGTRSNARLLSPRRSVRGQELGKTFRHSFGDDVGVHRSQLLLGCPHHGGSNLGSRGWSDSPLHHSLPLF